MVERTNAMNFGTVVCQLCWDGKTRGITKLPAIPQIGSLLMLEFGEDEVHTYEVVQVQMTAAPMDPETFARLSESEMPLFANYVKVHLRDAGPALTEADLSTTANQADSAPYP